MESFLWPQADNPAPRTVDRFKSQCLKQDFSFILQEVFRTDRLAASHTTTFPNEQPALQNAAFMSVQCYQQGWLLESNSCDLN